MLVFYNNNEQLGNSDRNITNVVKIGNNLIKFYQDIGEDKFIAVSLIDDSFLSPNNELNFNLARIGGIPLSISACYDTNTDPSREDNIGNFSALDVIIYSPVEDSSDENTVPSKPIVNGVEMGISKENNLYYIKGYQTTTSPSPISLVNFGGVPMAYGEDNELIIRDSGYSINDIDRYEELNFFGVPVRVGMISSENKYFLILSLTSIS